LGESVESFPAVFCVYIIVDIKNASSVQAESATARVEYVWALPVSRIYQRCWRPLWSL